MKGQWATILGAIIFITGCVWVSRRQIPVGVLGKDPAFHIRGRLAIALGDRAFKLRSGSMSEYGRYVKPLRASRRVSSWFVAIQKRSGLPVARRGQRVPPQVPFLAGRVLFSRTLGPHEPRVVTPHAGGSRSAEGWRSLRRQAHRSLQ